MLYGDIEGVEMEDPTTRGGRVELYDLCVVSSTGGGTCLWLLCTRYVRPATSAESIDELVNFVGLTPGTGDGGLDPFFVHPGLGRAGVRITAPVSICVKGTKC